jgi:spore photoproduct lyase
MTDTSGVPCAKRQTTKGARCCLVADIPDTLRVLNLGELCDPLAVEDITGFAEKLIPFVAKRTAKTRLLFLTKSDNIERLLGLHHNRKSIMSFSVNTDKVYRHLEHRTAPPEARLLAAQQLQKAGYEIRLRIDPTIIYEGWQADYIGLVDTIFRYVQPTRITIGEYRPSKGLVNHIGSRFPESTLIRINDGLVSDGTKLRYPEKERVAAFRVIIDRIRHRDTEVPISLCKESPAIWKQLDMRINGLYCNCLG